MNVSRDYISKLDSTEKHDSNFGNLCMKKGFQKMFSFLFQLSMGGRVDPRNPHVRTPLIDPMQSYVYATPSSRYSFVYQTHSELQIKLTLEPPAHQSGILA